MNIEIEVATAAGSAGCAGADSGEPGAVCGPDARARRHGAVAREPAFSDAVPVSDAASPLGLVDRGGVVFRATSSDGIEGLYRGTAAGLTTLWSTREPGPIQGHQPLVEVSRAGRSAQAV